MQPLYNIFFLSILQLPQTEIDGLDPNCRRFRLENGESLAEKDEVKLLFKALLRIQVLEDINFYSESFYRLI